MENSPEQPLTKKERKELKRKEKEAARASQERKRKVRKFLSWGAGIAVVVLAVWGMVYLAQNSGTANPEQTGSLLQVKENDWTQGNPDASVTLIEYLDFQCPACGAYHPIVKQLKEEYRDQVLFVARHLPLTQIHKNAMPAALAAEAAGRQGKFWEMHDTLFERQKEWSNVRNPEDMFASYAEGIGLNQEQFLSDYKDKSLDEKIEADRNSAFRLGAQSTPTFFLNGEKIQNPRGYEAFKSLIQTEIDKNK